MWGLDECKGLLGGPLGRAVERFGVSEIRGKRDRLRVWMVRL